MPWETFELNDGHKIPSLAFGTWKIGNGDGPVSQVDQAISVGFSHVDTAQLYRNETEAGIAIRDSGLPRENIFITTKYSGFADIQTSIRDSLKYLGVSYVDLYLIHSPRLALPDIPTIWKEMEEIKSKGMAKSIGVSNFNAEQLAILLASAKVKPVANQILLHPYVYAQQRPILEYAANHQIVIEAYSALIPITSLPGGPLDAPLAQIADKHGVTTDQILLAWTKAKGAVVVTTSSKNPASKDTSTPAISAILSEDDIAAIDAAGAKEPPLTAIKKKIILTVGILSAIAAGLAFSKF